MNGSITHTSRDMSRKKCPNRSFVSSPRMGFTASQGVSGRVKYRGRDNVQNGRSSSSPPPAGNRPTGVSRGHRGRPACSEEPDRVSLPPDVLGSRMDEFEGDYLGHISLLAVHIIHERVSILPSIYTLLPLRSSPSPLRLTTVYDDAVPSVRSSHSPSLFLRFSDVGQCGGSPTAVPFGWYFDFGVEPEISDEHYLFVLAGPCGFSSPVPYHSVRICLHIPRLSYQKPARESIKFATLFIFPFNHPRRSFSRKDRIGRKGKYLVFLSVASVAIFAGDICQYNCRNSSRGMFGLLPERVLRILIR